MKKLVLLDVNEDVLRSEGTSFNSEMGWIIDSGMRMIDSVTVPDSTTNIQDCICAQKVGP
ncbi:MAG: hypothetical protein RR415_13415 [Ruthenibacterium sp.]